MKYLLTIYTDESGYADVTPEEAQQAMAAYEAFGREVTEAGAMLGGEGLLLDCRDLDEAIAWAAKIPGAQNGTIEVRPVMDYEASGMSTEAEAHEGVR